MMVELPPLVPFQGDKPITVTGVPYLYNPMNHLIQFNEWTKQAGASVHFSVETFKLNVKLGRQSIEFYPQFVAMAQSDSLTSFAPVENFTFIGWNAEGDDHIWKLSIDKIFFKSKQENSACAFLLRGTVGKSWWITSSSSQEWELIPKEFVAHLNQITMTFLARWKTELITSSSFPVSV